ncbi:pyroglutamyl-peptidase I [Kitasatospora sp. NPDC056651]|uniref:pyroglutamyl-peptidase I n=1 Tax=Kitasatospora sp. NPDC056651 TaxID=3345892 RepID=UPI00369C224D
MIRVLLTAFEPFGRDPLNSSLEAGRLVVAGPPAGVALEFAELPWAFGDSVTELRRAVTRFEPDLVIATGQGGNRPDLTVERVAINLDDAVRAPDRTGNQPVDQPVVPDGPAAYFSSLPVKACVEAIQQAGIPATVSHTAGTHVGNHVFYGLAHLIATERPRLHGGFAQLPYLPSQTADQERSASMSAETAAEGVRILIRSAVAALHPPTAGPVATPRRRAWLPRRGG